MGMVDHGALASAVVARKNMMWEVPDLWTLEDAATVPVVYGTVSQKNVT
jgi:fatty acid synthase